MLYNTFILLTLCYRMINILPKPVPFINGLIIGATNLKLAPNCSVRLSVSIGVKREAVGGSMEK